MATSEFSFVFFLIAVIIVGVKAVERIMDRYNQPRVIGEVILGVILGPSIIGIITLNSPSSILTDMFSSIHHEDIVIAAEIMRFIAEVGVLFLLFEVGMEIEFDVLRRVGKIATGAAVGGILTPFVAGLGLIAGAVLILSPEILLPEGTHVFEVGMFFGAALTATSVGISIRVFIEMNQLNTRVARTVVSAAVIDDIISIILLTLAITYADETNAVGLLSVLTILFQIIGFFVIAAIIYRYIFPWFINKTRNSSDRYLPLMSSLSLLFFLAWLAFNFHLASIIGSFLAGLTINQDTEFVNQVKTHFSPIAHWIMPFFFISVGLQVDASSLLNPVIFLLSIVITVIAILTKFIGGLIGTYFSHFTMEEGKIVGMAMAARGEVTLIFAFEAFALGFFTQELFSALIISVILNAVFVPSLLSRMYSNSEVNTAKNGVDNSDNN